jgi:hypothetical protein
MQPVSFCMPLMFFRGCMSSTALTLDGLGRMPSRLTIILLGKIPEGMPKMHFLVELPLVLIKSPKSSLKVVNKSVDYPGFHDHVVYIGLNEVISYFIMKALLNGTLVCCPCIFSPKDIVV